VLVNLNKEHLMSRLNLAVPFVAVFALAACGPIEVRVSKAQGVRALNGTLTASLTGNTKVRVRRHHRRH
jgi:hypothetical protein